MILFVFLIMLTCTVSMMGSQMIIFVFLIMLTCTVGMMGSQMILFGGADRVSYELNDIYLFNMGMTMRVIK